MKMLRTLTGLFLLSTLLLSGCSGKSELDPDEPVTLTMWHVYGEQADSPMNRLVAEFNETVGKEKGIVIDVTMMTNATEIGGFLLSAEEQAPGAPQMPDLFSAHVGNVAELDPEQVLDWQDWFSEEEIQQFVPAFTEAGMLDGRLTVLPVSKSTNLLFLNGSQFARFSADTGVTEADLATWDGVFDAAARYYDWSGGKTMLAIDYLMSAIDLDAMATGDTELYSEDGWYNLDNPGLKASYLTFLRSLVQGHIALSDHYSNTQVMTGETLGGIGSSAAILYYNDVVTYPDNTTEPTNLRILPYPKTAGGKALMTQAGVGLCAYKTTAQKAEAASVFAHWLVEPERNLNFVVETGYMPVSSESFDAIESYDFPDEARAALYDAFDRMRKDYTAVSESRAVGYYGKIAVLYEQLREMQPVWKERAGQGEDPDLLAAEAWELFCGIQ